MAQTLQHGMRLRSRESLSRQADANGNDNVNRPRRANALVSEVKCIKKVR